MPRFDDLPYPRRYNSLRLLGYDYNSVRKFCSITMITEDRRPVFADMLLAKSILGCLLNHETLVDFHLLAFTLMPDHLHLVGGVQRPELNLPILIGKFKSFTTQLYWKRSREILASEAINPPSQRFNRSDRKDSRSLISALLDYRATLRPEIIELRNWPIVQPGSFRKKHLWQTKFFDHVIRNDNDLRENLDYIAMNPVKAGYVTKACFYPYTGFLC